MVDRRDIAAARRFRVQSIGTVRRPGGTATEPGEFFDPWQESILEIDPRWAAGLEGLEAFSHLVVLFYLDRQPRRRTAGAPRRPEDHPDTPPVGFFATRTPKRPNPIGIACPRLIRRDGNRLVVAGIDAWDGTPILDVKGYYPRDELRPDATVPDWLLRLWSSHDTDERRHAPDLLPPPEGS
jgi:tRNA-Thr(GGU) m(6)t(6)A37 methyltransferase TsaA